MPTLSPEAQNWFQIIFLSILSVVLLSDLVLLGIWVRSKMRESEGKEPIFAPRWSLLDIYVGAQLIFMLTIISGIGLFIFVLLKNPQNYDALMNDTSVQKTLYQIIIPSAILQNLATALVVFGYVRFRYHIKIRDFVFGNRPLKGLLFGVVVGIPVVLLVMGIEQLGWLETLNHQLNRTEIGRYLSEMQKTMDATWVVQDLIKSRLGFFWALLTLGIIAPIGEEIFFRGFLFNGVKQRFGVVAGIIVSSLLFAMVHLQIVNLVLMVLMAAVLAYSYYRTKSLLTPIVIHAINNSLVVVLAYMAPKLVK